MTTTKISDLTELTAVASDDVLPIVDTSTSTTKKITVANLMDYIGAKYTSDADQAISTVAYGIIDFEDVVYDTDSAVTTGANWKFTAPVTGYYLVIGGFTTNNIAWTAGNWIEIDVYKDGGQYDTLSRLTAWGASFRHTVRGSAIVYLEAGHYLDLRAETTQAGVTANLQVSIMIGRIG